MKIGLYYHVDEDIIFTVQIILVPAIKSVKLLYFIPFKFIHITNKNWLLPPIPTNKHVFSMRESG